MGNFNINIDRPKITNDIINSKQDFNQVIEQYKFNSIPIYKKPWFWGSAGLACLGVATIISLNQLNGQQNEKLKNVPISSELPQDTECIKPPIKELKIPFETYQVDAKKDEKIILESGTSIHIPKGSLVVSDDDKMVDIKIREFRDLSSSYIAGIPMDYNKNNAFESAGMIEIRGEQGGKPVDIKKEKPLEVNLVCTKNPDNFQFWKLNEKDKKWENYPLKNEKVKETKNEKDFNKQKNAVEHEIIITNKKIEAINTKLSLLKEPEKETFNIPTNKQKFDLAFDKNEYPELAKFQNLVFEVVPESGYDKSFTKKNWSDVDLKKINDNYFMQFSNNQEKFKIEVRPVLSGNELTKAKNEFDKAVIEFKETKANYNNEKKELELKNLENEKRLQNLLNQDFTTKNTLNGNKGTNDNFKSFHNVLNYSNTLTFQTNSWGVFNSDRPILYPNPFENEPAMVWKGSSDAKFKQIVVFNLAKNNRFVYGTYNQPISNFGIHKKDDLVIIGIDNDGNLGYLELKNRTKNENFSKLEFTRKDKNENTQELLKKLLDETVEVS